MHRRRNALRAICVAVGALAVSAIGIVPSASAHTGEWAKFDQCPSTTPGVFKCINSLTVGGTVVLGKKTVPIVNPVLLQGGFSAANAETRTSTFFGAANGETLAKVPQPVPGGLAGLVNCKEIESFLVRIGCEAVFENGLTGVNATLELARPASEIQISEFRLIARKGAALTLPVRVHLENPLLGSGCYVGSSSTPLLWNLTTGTTTPPEGVEPITGSRGTATLTEESKILTLTGSELVDNTWSAPHASGCGGFGVELILDPIIDSQVGLPAGAGVNESILKANTSMATASEVNVH